MLPWPTSVSERDKQPGLFELPTDPETTADARSRVRVGSGGRKAGPGVRPRTAQGPVIEDLDDVVRRLEATGRYRVLRRFEEHLDGPPPAEQAAGLGRGVYLDVETTGFAQEDAIIELAMLVFHFDRGGRVVSVSEAFDAFEDPGRRIPQEIVALTGITDAMVRGRRIDDAAVAKLLEGTDIVVAHNAGFDRPFVEARFPFFAELPWACSIKDVDWTAGGHRSHKLENLALAKGFFYQAHRAIYDCHVGVGLLRDPVVRGGATALADLLARSGHESVRLWAVGSPFDRKDDLKARSYRWSSRAKVWWRDLPADQHEAELGWLSERVYPRRPPLPYLRVDARLRYSSRLPETPPHDAERL